MATDKQIAANRANAKRSTGPKTGAGKLVSSRNAYRHGLSCPLPSAPATIAKADAIVHAVLGEGASEERLNSATEEFAYAQLELLRIRSTRTGMMAKLEPRYGDPKLLRGIVALDRYERYSLTKRRRASHKL